MKIEIFEPPQRPAATKSKMPTISADVPLETLLGGLQETGIDIQRYELDGDPLAFAAHTGVAELLRARGTGALPAIFIDGALVSQGDPPQVTAVKQALAVRGVAF